MGKDLFGTTERLCDFSDCRTYRYRLEIRWGNEPACNFVMLNPSTADEVANDPTVERCERRAVSMGYGALVVTNLFAFRATLPTDMKRAADPIGPRNDAVILDTARSAGIVVCGWGADGPYKGRAAGVLKLLKAAGVKTHALKLTNSGEPYHPLYVAYAATPFEF